MIPIHHNTHKKKRKKNYIYKIKILNSKIISNNPIFQNECNAKNSVRISIKGKKKKKRKCLNCKGERLEAERDITHNQSTVGV